MEPGQTYRYRVQRFKNGFQSEFSEPVVVNVITALEDSHDNAVQIFPNPFTHTLNINASKNQGREVSVVVYNSRGEIAKSFNFSSEIVTVDVKDLPIGLLFFHIKGEKINQRIKVARK